MKWIEKLKSIRAVSTPIVALETVDPSSTAKQIGGEMECPVIWWDCAAGPRPLTESSREVCASIWSDPYSSLNLVEVLKTAERLPERSILLIANAHRFLEEPAVFQAVGNLRDAFRDGRTLILLVVPGARIPQELSQDILVLARPLPSPLELRPIVDEIAKAASEHLGGLLQDLAPELLGIFFIHPGDCEIAAEEGNGCSIEAPEFPVTPFLETKIAHRLIENVDAGGVEFHSDHDSGITRHW